MPKLMSATTELMVENPAKSIEFYRDLLGFTVEVSVPENTPFFVILQNGPVQLMLYQRAQFAAEIPQFSSAPIGGSIALYLEVEDIELLYQQLQPQVTIIQTLHTTDYGSTEFSCLDCNGYVLMFHERKAG